MFVVEHIKLFFVRTIDNSSIREALEGCFALGLPSFSNLEAASRLSSLGILVYNELTSKVTSMASLGSVPRIFMPKICGVFYV